MDQPPVPDRDSDDVPDQPMEPVTPDPLASAGEPLAGAESETPAVGDDLPEWEPLTPELLEDEAIRGDFVLRWTVVVVALLAGCTEIRDARPLVHVRIGQWLAEHRFLPPATDPFSLTAGEQRWVNLAWLFDLTAAGIHAAAGAIGLSLMQGAFAAATIAAVLLACRAGVRTWWGSLCGALLILAAYPQWEWRPEIITLGGTAALLWWLVTRAERASPRQTWLVLPGGLWLWSQLDPRAWLGLGILLLYALGQSLARRDDPLSQAPRAAHWWRICVVAALTMLVHPFGWETWLAPLRQYLVEYPALRLSYPRPTGFDTSWYPLYSNVVWQQVDHRLAASLLLTLAALSTLLLNIRRAPAVHWLWWLGANALAVATTHELAFAAVVNCVVATVQAQDWYFARFGQVYTVVWPEILFSRAGRAVTLIGFFGLGWLIVSGRLDGPDAHRTGLGLSRGLEQELDDFRRLAVSAPDDRAFHLTLRQGDALIAAGRRSYVDHRVSLFSGAGTRNVLELHQRARNILRRSSTRATPTEQAEIFAAAFEAYEISHVLPRLSQELAPPDYQTFLELLAAPAWTLVEVLPTTGVFVRSEGPNREVNRFAETHSLNALQLSFRRDELLNVEPHDRVQPLVWSQRWLSLPSEAPARGTQVAEHWLRMQRELPAAPLPFQLAASLIEIRAAQEGVDETPQLAEAYHTLGAAYAYLLRLEGSVLASEGVNWGQSLRFYQAVSALRQAELLEPDDPATQLLLAELWQGAGKADVTYEALDRFLALTVMPAVAEDEAAAARRESLEGVRSRLMDVVADNNLRVESGLTANTDRLQLALGSYQAGCLNRAIQLLQDDAIYVERNPVARLQLTAWLAERGDGLALDDSALSLEGVGANLGVASWRDPLAYAALGRADYQAAIENWRQAARDLDAARLTSLLFTTPLATSSPFFLGDAQFPLSHLLAIQDASYRQALAVGMTEWQRAMCELERGNRGGAEQGLRRALELAPTSPLRPMLRLYWFCLTDELLDEEPPHDWIPVDRDLFPADSSER